MTAKLILGCGYLGRRVAAAWLNQGDDVYAVTRSPDRAARWRSDGLRPMVADVCDVSSLDALPEVETVLYAIGYDRGSGRSQREVAVEGLRNVLPRCHCRRFVFISSSSVYGQSSGEWVDETSPCEPTQPGGECCLAAEQLLREAFPPTSGTSAQVLRLSGIYGPGRLPRRDDAIFQVALRLAPDGGERQAAVDVLARDHEVLAVVGEQVEPLVEAVLVEQVAVPSEDRRHRPSTSR